MPMSPGVKLRARSWWGFVMDRARYRTKSKAICLPIYWTGPSVGFDLGAMRPGFSSLIYNLYDSADITKRYPEGRAISISLAVFRDLFAAGQCGPDPDQARGRRSRKRQYRLYEISPQAALAAVLAWPWHRQNWRSSLKDGSASFSPVELLYFSAMNDCKSGTRLADRTLLRLAGN